MAEDWREALEALACHAERPEAGPQPCDFPLVGLAQAQVEHLEARCPGLGSHAALIEQSKMRNAEFPKFSFSFSLIFSWSKKRVIS